MILKIRNSRIGKVMSLFMVFVLIMTLNPSGSYALTGGPAQPEFNSFTPIGTSDMVDLASGDFSYNIPLMDIGGFPINLAYSSGVTMDQEASWVGLGWDLSIGQINRQMRGLPDDFDGEQVQYENNIKDNYTVGATFSGTLDAFGIEAKDIVPLKTKLGISAQYNSYNGLSINPSAGITFDISKNASVGLNVSSGEDGLTLRPNASLHAKYKSEKNHDHSLKGNIGLSFNSRQGLSSVNMSASTAETFRVNGKKHYYSRQPSIGSSVSYVQNTYTPTIQDGLVSANFTFNAGPGMGVTFFGLGTQGELTAFGSNQFLKESEKNKFETVYGYNYTHSANKESVLDFNREKDGNFSVNTTNLPLTNYTYDIYSVQGQGVGGMFRPYRSQIGFVYDNETNTYGGGGSLGIETGTGNLFDIGVDIEVTVTSGKASGWWDKNNAIGTLSSTSTNDPNYQEVYYKNVGDLSADSDLGIYGTQTSTFGGYFPSRFALGGEDYDRELLNENEIKHGGLPNTCTSSDELNEEDIKRNKRVLKNQNVLDIKMREARDAELGDSPILGFELTSLPIDGNQTAGFIVTRNDGARYVYGKALYNTTKREVTFAMGTAVGGDSDVDFLPPSLGDASTGLINYIPGIDNSIDNKRGDHYFNRVTTPEYAHTYLLTTLVSTDYSDVDGIPGPSAGDFGSYTLFEYETMEDLYKWRIPFEANSANFNEGLKTNKTDDKGSYIYGEKELSYIKKIETKTHVAVFEISPREDAYGVIGENGGRGEKSVMYKLDKIVLYSRGEYYEADGVTVIPEAVPIKTVNFVYDYSQCKGVPNNRFIEDTETELDDNEISNEGGKLTLKKVYFTYRNSNMGKYSSYDFTYGDTDHDPETSNPERNPDYNLKGYDVWGNYKPNNGTVEDLVEDPISAPAFNYTEQNDPYLNDYMAAWSLSDIELPSGGKIKIDYEADDYQFVQDKKAMQMFKIIGAGAVLNPDGLSYFQPSTVSDNEGLLYKIDAPNNEAKYLYIRLDDEDQSLSTSIAEIESSNYIFYQKYLREIHKNQNDLVQFRFLMNMNQKGGEDGNKWRSKGDFDYVSGYFELDIESGYGIFESDGVKYGSIPMKFVDKGDKEDEDDLDFNPISKAGWQFGRKYLSKYVYGFPEPDPSSGLSAIVNTIIGSIDGLKDIFFGPNGTLRSDEIGRRFIPEKSWIRLANPNSAKKGGGCRVKQLVMTDEWASMTEGDPSVGQKYGQEYQYNLLDGSSSGVATYEPVGAKDNPLVQPVFVNINRVLAPDEENYMEKPFGESFFPSPSVTYSRVIVKNIERYQSGEKLTKHATGEVVTEFFTSKDYPTIVDQTKMAVHEDKPGILGNLLNIYQREHLTVSQGYLIHLNDMNGKMKSQRVFAEGQEDYISGVDYYYDHYTSNEVSDDPFTLVSHNAGKLDNKVKVLYPNGKISEETIGVEFDVINDFREKKSSTNVGGINTNLNTFLVGVFPVLVPLPVPDFSHHEDKLNIATTTKVINTFAIQKEVVAHDAGASVYTRNLLWDATTGEVLLTETVNEYGDKYYSFNFPAYWYYDGMGMASKNSGNYYGFSSSGDGFALNPYIPGTENKNLVNGDEVILADFNLGDPIELNRKAWVHHVTTSSFKLMDESGAPIELINDFGLMKVIRSGRRNLQSTSMASVVLKENPLNFFTGGKIPLDFLNTLDWNKYKIVNAGAVEFSDNWSRQCECGVESDDPNFNAYVQNEKGVWRADKSWLYLTGRHHNNDNPDPRNDGYYNSFSPFYYVDGGGNWHKHKDNWTYTSEVTAYSPYGFELENKDALQRRSAAQYGYNFSFPLAVGANTSYSQMGYDGFEDYNFDGCTTNEHFGFRDPLNASSATIVTTHSHTGKYSLKLERGSSVSKVYHLDCGVTPEP